MSPRSRIARSYMPAETPYDTKTISSQHLGHSPNQGHQSVLDISLPQSTTDYCFTPNQYLQSTAVHCVPSQLVLHQTNYDSNNLDAHTDSNNTYNSDQLALQHLSAPLYTSYQPFGLVSTQPTPYDVYYNNYSDVVLDQGYGYAPIYTEQDQSSDLPFLFDGSRESSVLSSAFSAATAQIWSPVSTTADAITSPTPYDYTTFSTSPLSSHQDVAYSMDASTVAVTHCSLVDVPMEGHVQYVDNTNYQAHAMPYQPPQGIDTSAPTLMSSPLSGISTASTIDMPVFNFTTTSATRPLKKIPSSGRATPIKSRSRSTTTVKAPSFRVEKAPKKARSDVEKTPEPWQLAVVAYHATGKYTFKQIQKKIWEEYGVEKAETSLRGTKRNVITPKEHRVRSPLWEDKHIHAMFEGVLMVERKTSNRVPWQGVSNYIFEKTNRRFGAANVHKMYDAKMEEMEVAAATRPCPPRVPGHIGPRL